MVIKDIRRSFLPKKSPELIAAETHLNEALIRLSSLQPDFDEQGSLPPSKETIQFAIEYIQFLFSCYDDCYPLPDIGPGPEASIDLLFSSENWEILLNFATNNTISWISFFQQNSLSSGKVFSIGDKCDFVNVFHSIFFHLATRR